MKIRNENLQKKSKRFNKLYSSITMCLITLLPNSQCHICDSTENIYSCCPFKKHSHRLCYKHLTSFMDFNPNISTIAVLNYIFRNVHYVPDYVNVKNVILVHQLQLLHHQLIVLIYYNSYS